MIETAEASRLLLEANLSALDEVSPELSRRLRRQVNDTHLIHAPDGTIHYRKGLTSLPVSIPRVELSGQAPRGDERELFVFGVGVGEILAHVLSVYQGRKVIAWDRDPSMLRLALSRVALADSLRSGRLRLLLGSDLLQALPLADRVVIQHPLLGNVYGEELFLLSHPLGDRRAVMIEGGLFVTELTLELQRQGFSVYPMHLSRLAPEEQRLLLDRVRPQVVAAINYTEGLAELCAVAGCKLMFWEIDPAVHDGERRVTKAGQAFAFTFRKAYVDELRAMGFKNVEQLPLAADPHIRKPVQFSEETARRYAAPISFVGISMVEDVPAWEQTFLRIYCARYGSASRVKGQQLLEAVLAEQRLDFSRNRFPELLAESCPGWPPRDLQQLIRCASEIGSAERRIVYASRLGKFGIQVWGDAGWRVAGGAKVTYRGPATNFVDLNPIYCASRINLDIGRLHQLDIVTMRNFDILACGGFVLAERSADLERLFEIDEEIACYTTLQELEQKVAFYLAHPEAARTIAAAGQRAVLERHTLSLRVGHMLRRIGLS